MSVKVVPVFDPLPDGYTTHHIQHNGKGFIANAWETQLWHYGRLVKTVFGATRQGNHQRLLEFLRAQSN